MIDTPNSYLGWPSVQPCACVLYTQPPEYSKASESGDPGNTDAAMSHACSYVTIYVASSHSRRMTGMSGSLPSILMIDVMPGAAREKYLSTL